MAFTPDQFWKVNGYSNLYFGWGGEDDDIVTRSAGLSAYKYSLTNERVGRETLRN